MISRHSQYSRKILVFRVIAAFVITYVPTIIAYLLLGADSGLIVLSVYAFAGISLSSLRAFNLPRLSQILTIALLLIHLTGAAVIIVNLNLTPSSAYLAWFRIAQDGKATGILSFMFTLKICFFSTLFGGLIIRHGLAKPFLGMAALVLIIFYSIFQYQILGITAAVFLFVGICTLVLRGPSGTKGRLTLTMLQLTATAMLIALPLSLIRPGSGSMLVNPIPSDKLMKAVSYIYPEFPFLYNMPGYGHQLGSSSIGGRPALTGRPVFEVSGTPGETVYLRTAIFDYYTGNGWASNASRLETAGFGFERYFVENDGADFTNPLSITVLVDFFSSVPHTVTTRSIVMNDGDRPELVYGSPDTGFLFDIPVVSGTRFTVDRRNSGEEIPEQLEAYLQLPPKIPQDAVALARLLGESGDPDKTAERIKEYLAVNFYYTLEPNREKDWDDPAWDFLLSTGEGYCVHFATSFVLLARMNNIPARYVSGFLVNIPNNDDTTIVKGYSSHAWAEIFDPARGWVVKEATPPMTPEFFGDPRFFDLYNPFGSRYTAAQLESILGDRVTQVSADTGREISKAPSPLLLILIFASAWLIVGLYYFSVKSMYSFGSPGRKMRIISRRMIAKARRRGTPGPDTAGWVAWISDVAPASGPKRTYLIRSISLIQADVFGGRITRQRDLRFLRAAYRRNFITRSSNVETTG
jgi:transglutaminase-like putative cysteine protease